MNAEFFQREITKKISFKPRNINTHNFIFTIALCQRSLVQELKN